MKNLHENLPDSPGVYLFKDRAGNILYIGKAVNLKRRVSGYFLRPHDSRIQKLVSEIKKVDFKETESALEALILEAELIKKYKPPFNIKEKDDKSFLYVEITDEEFPRVLLVRGKSEKSKGAKRFGPFVSASQIRQALRILRKIFPFSIHPPAKAGKLKKACFDYQIGLCPGTCIGKITRKDYLKNIKNIELMFLGKKKKILRTLEKEMKTASKDLEFEKAAKIRQLIFALKHVEDIAFVGEPEFRNQKLKLENINSVKRIEGYDISNISGTSAVGSMVVFFGQKPAKDEYRKFKIYGVKKPDDIGMLKETLRRRFNHMEWKLPDLILVDGGKGQVNAAKKICAEFGLKIPVIGVAKGASRKKNEILGKINGLADTKTLIKIRDEAHRFAVDYHRRLRNKTYLK